MQRRPAVASSALVATDLATLTLARPDFGQLATDLAAPHDWLARVGVDGAVARLAIAGLWLTAAWLAVGLVAAVAGRLPGAAGQLATRAAALVLPRALRSVLAGCAGLGVLLAPVAAGANSSTADPAVHAAVVAHGAVGVPSPGWPISTRPRTTDPLPAPSWPVEHRPDDADRGSTRRTTVHRGESLWVIAARRLGPHATPADIAAAWPRWYAANRDVIGDDPGLIVPGQVLHAPATVTEEHRR